MARIKKKRAASGAPSESEIMGAMQSASTFLAAHRRTFTIAAIAVLLVAVVAGSLFFIRSARDRKASPLVSVAYEYYEPTDGTPPDYQKALELFRDIRKSYAGTTSGAVAQFFIANSLMNLGRTDEALKEYQTFVKDYSGRKAMLGLVHQRLGYIYRGMGNREAAERSFLEAERLQGTGLPTVELARLYERSGRVEESRKKYKDIMEKLPESQWAFEAMTKLPPPEMPEEQPKADVKGPANADKKE